MIDLFRPRVSWHAVQAVIDRLEPDKDGRLFIGQGPVVDAFERYLASWVGTYRVLALNSGTSALTLVLRLAGVKHGDTVVSTPMTCFATNAAIAAMGARIAWADIDPETGNIDPMSVTRVLARLKRTGTPVGAVTAVDYGGYPVDALALWEIGQRFEVPVIEDAAHAFGATYQDRPVGSLSDFTAFSFQAVKPLTTIDGGALTCREGIAYERGKKLRWYGMDRTIADSEERLLADIVEPGYKFHMNDVTAAMGCAQLEKVAETLAWQRAVSAYYREHLSGVSGVTLLKYAPDRQSSCYLFVVKVEDKPGFIARMRERGVMTGSVHVRNDRYACFSPYARPLPGVDAFDQHQVALPCHWALTEKDLEHVVQAVRESVC